MSVRRHTEGEHVQLQRDLESLRKGAIKASAADGDVTDETISAFEARRAFDQLTPTEQAAASLGVAPDGFKPIGWLNQAHYEQLKKNNALSSGLQRRIEAFRKISAE